MYETEAEVQCTTRLTTGVIWSASLRHERLVPSLRIDE